MSKTPREKLIRMERSLRSARKVNDSDTRKAAHLLVTMALESPSTMFSIQAATGMQISTVSRIVSELTKDGRDRSFIEKALVPRDPRQTDLVLTAGGWSFVEKLVGKPVPH